MIWVTEVHMEGGQGHEHIARLKWQEAGTTNSGDSTTAEVVGFIDRGVDAQVNDSRSFRAARVGVVRPVGHPPYLRTYADGVPTDNLLQLPRY